MTTTAIIPGLKIIPNYVSLSEEMELIHAVDSEIWLTDLQRRVQHYGWRYDYRARSLDASQKLGALPDWAERLAERLHTDGYIPEIPDQLIVNEYHPGQGIAPHVDCVPCFQNNILSLSLGSMCVMVFDALQQIKRQTVVLNRGDLLVMEGEARYRWKHSIPARKSDVIDGATVRRGRRISLTFRRVIVAEIPVS